MDLASDNTWVGSDFGYAARATNFVPSPGNSVDVAAPAVNILSTYFGSGYHTGTGASASASHATELAALYIAANGRATNAAGVYHILQMIIDHLLPQSQWSPNGQPFDAITNPTGDPDGYPEPLAMPSEAWVPQPGFHGVSQTPQGYALNCGTVPGYQYTVKYRDSLITTNVWNDLTITNGTGKLTTVTVSDTTPGDQRFYRLERKPAP